MRLVVATTLVVALGLLLARPAIWGSDESACRMAFVYAALGAMAMICVAPVLRRGTDLQRVAAVVLLILSCLALWPAVDFYLSN